MVVDKCDRCGREGETSFASSAWVYDEIADQWLCTSCAEEVIKELHLAVNELSRRINAAHGFWEIHKSDIDELAKMQGVKPIKDVSKLKCDVFESDEELFEFLASIGKAPEASKTKNEE